MKHSYSNDDTCLSTDVIDEILEEDFDALLDEDSKILHSIEDIPGICPSFCKHKIQLLDDKKPVVQKQRRLNPNMKEVVKKEIMKLLDTAPYSSFKMIIHHKRTLILCISLDRFSCCFAYIVMLPKRWKDICKAAREVIQNDTKDEDPPMMDDHLKRTIWGCKRLETNSVYAEAALGFKTMRFQGARSSSTRDTRGRGTRSRVKDMGEELKTK
ncbi:hypothetical protein Tco_1285238 [Tanacetum coccineum]